MSGLAYLFERFPSFTQTFCYREIEELRRQNTVPAIFSVRHPHDEPPQAWDPAVVRDVEYLPDEKALIAEVDHALRKGKLPAAANTMIAEWGRKTDFLRLYQAAWLGPRLQKRAVRHVHAHFAGLAARTGYWLKQFFDIGYSFTAHANDIFAPKPFEVSLGRLITEARAVVTVSDFGVRFLQEKFPKDAARIHRVYNGIDPSVFQLADFAAETPVIISVGRLIEKKGFQDLIEACRLLRESGIKFRCEIIGEGPLEPALREQIATSGLTEIIRLAGPLPQEEVIRRLSQSWVFALPCVTETDGGMDQLPTVVMEAMAAGLPVVSTPISGLPEMVIDGQTGMLVSEHQPHALAEALGRMLNDRERARSLGRAGRQRASSLFAIETSASKLRHLFQGFGAVS
ncbi:MAG TPA: glycosyltransferase family 4 protein [Chthoniobacterales bacterium]|jgi:glycosyltransferase involved in cell wall biosynthesis